MPPRVSTQPATRTVDTWRMRHSSASILLLLPLFGWCGCFRGLEAVRGETATRPAIQLEVHDRHAAVWQAEQAPRWPIFVLQFADSAPSLAERRLFLLRGTPTDELLADLSSAQLRMATEARRVPLALEAGAAELRAWPTRALEPGATYTLVWAHPDESPSFPIVISPSPAAGARLVQSLPAALERQVAPNLSHALLRFDGYVLGDVQRLVQLLDAHGQLVATLQRSVSCDELGLGHGDCLQLAPERELSLATGHRLLLTEGLEDATGAPIAPLELAFETAGQRDTRAPGWLPLTCARDELAQGPVCLLVSEKSVAVRARADENGLLSLAIGAELSGALGSSGDYTLDAALDAPRSAVLQLSDPAGNTTQLTLALEPARDLAAISIDEVRVDPRGPEPSQEYVELLNFGATSMSIAGFSLSDDAFAPGRQIEGELTLAAGERVLVVAADFDPNDPDDDAPAAGVRLARLSGSLTLRNEGSTLFLRDAHGRRVSAAPALAPERAGQCIVRVGPDHRSGKSSDFALDPSGGCSPGYATTPLAGQPPTPP